MSTPGTQKIPPLPMKRPTLPAAVSARPTVDPSKLAQSKPPVTVGQPSEATPRAARPRKLGAVPGTGRGMGKIPGAGTPPAGKPGGIAGRKPDAAAPGKSATLGSLGAAGDGTTARERAENAFNRAREFKNGTQQAAQSKLQTAKQAIGDVAQGAAQGAAKGAAGGAAGATAGAAKGAVIAAAKNPLTRKILLGILAVWVLGMLALPLIIGAIVTYPLVAITSNEDQSSFKAASASGVTQKDVNAARNDNATGFAPWTIILALKERTKQPLDAPKLRSALKEADPAAQLRDITAGSVYDDDKRVRKIGSSEAQKAAQATVKAVYVTALVGYGLTDGQAEAVYKTALRWALGEQVTCTPPVYAGEAGEAVTLDAEQRANALTIVGVAKYMFPAADQRRAAVIGIATARQESGLRSIDYGDEAGPDSRGLFQQRDSWGSLELRMNPAGAAGLFFKRLLTVDGWQQMTLGDASYKVQIFQEDLKHHYDKYEEWATDFVDHTFDSAPAVTPPAEVGAATGEAAGETQPSGCLVAAPGDWVTPIDFATPGLMLSDFYGPRVGIEGAADIHAGLDLSAPANTPVMAVHGGTVETAGKVGTFGNSIVILHDDGVRTRYSHLIDGGILVKKGNKVKTGQVIGKVGSTGLSTGNHLDFRTYLGSAANSNSQDPIFFMLERGLDFRVLPISPSLTTKPTF